MATSDNNGSFIDTLKMSVYNVSWHSVALDILYYGAILLLTYLTLVSHFSQDSDYSNPLVVPPKGIVLRTRIHVEVKAVNLTGK